MPALKAAWFFAVAAVVAPTAASAQLEELRRPPIDAAGRAQYAERVVAHLSLHKKYPEEANEQKLEGKTVVTFVIDAQGAITSVAVKEKSGVDLLDQEAEQMVRRAAPFPPPPDKRPTSFTAPISFRWGPVAKNGATAPSVSDSLSGTPAPAPNPPAR